MRRQDYITEQPSMHDLAGLAAVSTVLSLVDTIKLGRIVTFDPDACTADVELVQFEPFEDEEGEVTWEQPVGLFDAPVLFPRGGDYSDTWPLAVGDPVVVLICERSIDEWRAGGEPGEQADERRWDTQDGLVLPLGFNNVALTTARAGRRVVAGPTIALSDPDAAAPVARAPDVASNHSSIATAITTLQGAIDGIAVACTAIASTPGLEPTAAAAFLALATAIETLPPASYTPTDTAADEVLVP